METTTETEERFMIREKDCSKPPRGSDACYDIQVLIGNVRAAFTYNIPEDPKQDLIANTWNGNTAYFLGLVTPPVEGCLYIANCACVMRRFTTKKFWKKDWLIQEREWFICATTKCSSMCCQACFEGNKVKKIGDAYKCPFPCKTGMTYNKCNDPKKISKMLKRVEKDEKKCANCGMTRKMFWKRKPFCKLLSFATFPDGSGKL
jgi:hypothetical protein